MQKTFLSESMENCKKLIFEGFHLYYTSEISEEEVRFYCWNHYIEAYILSNLRLSYVIIPNFSMDDFDLKNKKIKMFLTSDRKLYGKILKENGMDKYAKLEQGFGFVPYDVYAEFIDEDIIKNFLPINSRTLDEHSHEFTHLLIHYYFNIERKTFVEYCGYLIDEAIATLINNQFKYWYCMKMDLKNNKKIDLNKINVKNIRDDGILSVDNRYVEENFAYQYASLFVKTIDEKIRKTEKYKSDIPLSGLLSFIKDGILNKRKNLYVDLKEEMDLDLLDIEKRMRKGLEMKDL